MSTFTLSPQLKDRMLGKIPGVIQDGKDIYFQYDRLTIDPTTGKVEFFFANEPMFWMQSAPLKPGDVLTISGVEGRMKAHLIN